MKTEIQTLSKKEALLKCIIFLFILSLAVCVFENIDTIINNFL